MGKTSRPEQTFPAEVVQYIHNPYSSITNQKPTNTQTSKHYPYNNT